MSVPPIPPGVSGGSTAPGPRTITGVSTSACAFVGRALRGPVNEPVAIDSLAAWERSFGGLWARSTLSFAVQDFFRNGGRAAIAVRLFHPTIADAADRARSTRVPHRARLTVHGLNRTDRGTVASAARVVAARTRAAATDSATAADVARAARAAVAATTNGDAVALATLGADAVARAAEQAVERDGASALTVAAAAARAASRGLASRLERTHIAVGALNLEAIDEGSWGNTLRARIDTDVADATGSHPGVVFNLAVRDGSTGQVERFHDVSIWPDHPRRVDTVLARQSLLVRVRGALPSPPPQPLAVRVGLVPAGRTPFSTRSSSGVSAVGRADDGQILDPADYLGSEVDQTGVFALEKIDRFDLLCIPPPSWEHDVDGSVWSQAAYCEQRRAMLLIDPPAGWTDAQAAKVGLTTGVGTTSRNAAIYFPRLRRSDLPQDDPPSGFAPCGAVAGVVVRTDVERGVWKAPAGRDATLEGGLLPSVGLTAAETGELNRLGLNCLRDLPVVGPVIWGARTLQGDDRLASEWKYIPVRRLALFLEESIGRGLAWAVFEANDEPLWAAIRSSVEAFMHDLFRQGAFQGRTPQEGYLVKCDRETTTREDIDRGIVTIVVGFAPLKPAEFVMIRIQQRAGQPAT